jgi:hypothetical protein
MVFTAGTFIPMVASAEWRLWLVLTDPLAWMMLILASAAGVTTGYALGCRMPPSALPDEAQRAISCRSCRRRAGRKLAALIPYGRPRGTMHEPGRFV